MNERTKRHVLHLLEAAHERALASVRARLEGLPPEERGMLLEAIAAVRACLLRQFEGTVPAGESAARLAALIRGHPAASSVELMETYARGLMELLTASRNGLVSPREQRGH